MSRRFAQRATVTAPLALRGWSAAAMSLVASFVAPLSSLQAQARQEAPIAPSATIGPVTNSSTFSVLGVAALPEGGAMEQRNLLWLGATQPIARVAGIRLAAIASGYYRASDAVGSRSTAEGTVSLRALARVLGTRTWTAFSYGRAQADAAAPDAISESLLPIAPGANSQTTQQRGQDSTISSRADLSSVTRAEAGILTGSGPLEFSLGVSIERAARVTTQSQSVVDTDNAWLVQRRTVQSSVERREFATALASAGFRSGGADWLISMSAPITNHVDQKENSPRPRRMPPIATIAVVQPITAWLSVVGSASTNATTVGSNSLRDSHTKTPPHDFSPVLALGVRISRFSMPNRPGEPTGVLAFETRTIGIIDSAPTRANKDVTEIESDVGRELVRVLLVIDAPRAESVELMGDATGWSVTSMSRARDGKWRAELRVPPGMHRLAVRADGGSWIAPPGLPIGNDDFGSSVGLLVVKLRSY